MSKTRIAITLGSIHHCKGEGECSFIRVVSWNPLECFTATICLPRQVDQDAILSLLTRWQENFHKTQPMSLNFPAGFMVEVLNGAGFYAHQSLI